MNGRRVLTIVLAAAGLGGLHEALPAGPDAVRILGGRFTTDSATLEVEVRSRPEVLPHIESALSREADIARAVPP